MTFPTKHFYTDPSENTVGIAAQPFTGMFGSGACENWLSLMMILGRNGESDAYIGFPEPPMSLGFCYNTNVVPFISGTKVTSVLDSSTVGNVVLQTDYAGNAGWAHLSPPIGAALLGFRGQPAIGFSITERNNSAEAGNNRNYGSGRPHIVEVSAP